MPGQGLYQQLTKVGSGTSFDSGAGGSRARTFERSTPKEETRRSSDDVSSINSLPEEEQRRNRPKKFNACFTTAGAAGAGSGKQWYQFRKRLRASEWYHTVVAGRIRALLHGRKASLVMIAALLTAMFLPDLWVVLGINSNLEIDLVLSCVMVLFVVEITALSLVDAAYLFSFFHLMDVIGTASMIFDVSFLLGGDAVSPKITDDQIPHGPGVLLRSALQVCARAGRLSRILRILRFLPRGVEEWRQRKQGLAGVIAARLNHLLSTRVAVQTITLVMAMPFFDLLSFPQTDFSLQAWVERVSVSFEDGNEHKAMRDLAEMVQFFGNQRYGPYMACRGHTTDGTAFVCEEMLTGWLDAEVALVTSGPPREASALLVHTDSLLVGFNMHDPIKTLAWFTILNNVLLLLLIAFSGLALSSVVTELAVNPLERMLNTVRTMASTVVGFAGNIGEESAQQHLGTEENEMELLEQVVENLANIAALHAGAEETVATEGMEQEDLGVLSMMHGGALRMDRRSRRLLGSQSLSAIGRKNLNTTRIQLDTYGLSRDMLRSWSFNTLSMSGQQQCVVAAFTISEFHEKGEGFIRNKEHEEVLTRFIQACQKEYKPNPFHNFAHAADVVHGTAKIMRLTGSDRFVGELEQFALLIAAVGHDVGHPGVNNGFLSEVTDELAVRYNDKSPLENMHCATLYSILKMPECNVLGKLSSEQYRQMRMICIETILHTDMVCHQQMVKELNILYQVNSEVFQGQGESGARERKETDEAAVFQKPETKTLVLKMVLHSADVSNPCRTWDVTREWGFRVLEEFFSQGDQEKEKGIPVQFLNDRDKLNKPNSQIGFIEFMIAPFFVVQMQLFPHLRGYGQNLANNIGHWERMWIEESDPNDEEKTKVSQRVAKVWQNLSNAPLRLAA